MKVLKCFFASIIMLLASFNSGFANKPWVEVKLDIASCQISFPSKPVYRESSFHGWSARDKDDQVTYFLSYLHDPSVKITIQAVEQQLLPAMMSEDIQISKSYLKYKGYEAIDYLYRSKITPYLYKKGRIIIRNNRAYVAEVHYYHSNLADFDRFAKSLFFN